MKKAPNLVSCTILFAIAIVLTGCIELKDDFVLPSQMETKIHPPGFGMKEHENFHGLYIREQEWNFSNCQSCHGPAYIGGISNVSCMSSGCHVDYRGIPKSPESCNTCHGSFYAAADSIPSFAPPRDLAGNTNRIFIGVGAHQDHMLGSIMSDGIECAECHRVPAIVFENEHLLEKGSDKIAFIYGELASFETKGANMNLNPPTYDPDDVAGPSCSNTYCHGHFTHGNNYTPVWTVSENNNEASCGTCHGSGTDQPLPVGHFGAGVLPGIENCQLCHYLEPGVPIAERMTDGSYIIKKKSKHVDGAIYPFGWKRTDF